MKKDAKSERKAVTIMSIRAQQKQEYKIFNRDSKSKRKDGLK